MAQWGEKRRFVSSTAEIEVLPCVDTGGAFDPINLESTIGILSLMSKQGSDADVEELFERTRKMYVGRPYAEWRRPGPARPLPLDPPVSGRRPPPEPPSDLRHVSSHSGAREAASYYEGIPCMIRQAGDSTWCQTAGCGLRWDTNEEDPPKCPRIAVQQARRSAGYYPSRHAPSPHQAGSAWKLWLVVIILISLAAYSVHQEIIGWFR